MSVELEGTLVDQGGHYVPKKNVETGGDFEAFAIDLYEARPLITRLRTEFVSQQVSAWLLSIHF